jgi:hypothetical protein
MVEESFFSCSAMMDVRVVISVSVTNCCVSGCLVAGVDRVSGILLSGVVSSSEVSSVYRAQY